MRYGGPPLLPHTTQFVYVYTPYLHHFYVGELPDNVANVHHEWCRRAHCINDAHFFAGKAIEMYEVWYTDPHFVSTVHPTFLSPSKFPLTVRAHHCIRMRSASGNRDLDEPSNAVWDHAHNQMLLGYGWDKYHTNSLCIVGDDEYYPWVTLDIIAHELGHAVTDSTSKLYGVDNEPAALAESFSDMAGIETAIGRNK